jgi:hypothetical protein
VILISTRLHELVAATAAMSAIGSLAVFVCSGLLITWPVVFRAWMAVGIVNENARVRLIGAYWQEMDLPPEVCDAWARILSGLAREIRITSPQTDQRQKHLLSISPLFRSMSGGSSACLIT